MIAIGPFDPGYAALIDDIIRMIILQVTIHMMYVLEGADTLLSGQSAGLLLYACMGLAVYHFIFKASVVVKRKDSRGES